MRVAELYDGRDPPAVRAALVRLFDKRIVRREGPGKGLDDLSDEQRIFLTVMGTQVPSPTKTS